MLCCDVAVKQGVSVIFNAFWDLEFVSESIACLKDQVGPEVPFEVIVVVKNETESKLPDAKIVRASRPEASFRRTCGALQAQYSILVFLDDDCVVRSRTFLADLWNYFRDPENQVVAGLYAQAEELSYLARAYNHICNLWVLNSTDLSGACRNFLGGFFSVRKDLFPFDIDLAGSPRCGGDEYLIRNYFEKKNVPIKLSHLKVHHRPRGNGISFLKRAYIHGRYKATEKSVLRYKILFSNPWVLAAFGPAFFVHYCLVKVGQAGQLTEAIRNMSAENQKIKRPEHCYVSISHHHPTAFKK
jgi:hypothetical protein